MAVAILRVLVAAVVALTVVSLVRRVVATIERQYRLFWDRDFWRD